MTPSERLAERWKEIDAVLDRFDFEKVLNYMKSVDWKWRGENPALSDLKATAHMLLNTVVREDVQNASTGGFIALNLKYATSSRLQLIFCLEQESEEISN